MKKSKLKTFAVINTEWIEIGGKRYYKGETIVISEKDIPVNVKNYLEPVPVKREGPSKKSKKSRGKQAGSMSETAGVKIESEGPIQLL